MGPGGYDPAAGPHIAGNFTQKRPFHLNQARAPVKTGCDPRGKSSFFCAKTNLSKTYERCNRLAKIFPFFFLNRP